MIGSDFAAALVERALAAGADDAAGVTTVGWDLAEESTSTSARFRPFALDLPNEHRPASW